MSQSDEFRQIARSRFQMLRPALLDELGSFFNQQLPPEAVLLDIQIDGQGFANSFPVVIFVMGRNAGEVAPCQELLPDVDCTIPSEVIFDERYESVDIDTWGLATEGLIDWFAHCWREAGGLDLPVKAYIRYHDTCNLFGLNRGEWSMGADVWNDQY